MFKISIGAVARWNPCHYGFIRLLNHRVGQLENMGTFQDWEGHTKEFPLAEVLRSNPMEDALWALRCYPDSQVWRKFAVWMVANPCTLRFLGPEFITGLNVARELSTNDNSLVRTLARETNDHLRKLLREMECDDDSEDYVKKGYLEKYEMGYCALYTLSEKLHLFQCSIYSNIVNTLRYNKEELELFKTIVEKMFIQIATTGEMV